MKLEGRGLSCVRSDRVIFSDLDFDLDQGGALVLRGPNGSGKTSLLRLVAGLLKPAAGTVLWNGTPAGEDRQAHHARLNYVGHLDALKPAFTLAENLAFWAALRGAAGAERRALEVFGLSHLADVPARLMSAGQRRRAALARLAAHPATLWLLDEPTVSLDDQATAMLADLIARHRAGGGLVMVATHAVLDLADAAVLHLGTGAGGSGGGVG